MNPEIMLFDEATGALDPELVGEVLHVIRDLAQSGMTLVPVTHEVRFARAVGNRVMFMADGSVKEDGAPSRSWRTPSHPGFRTSCS